MEKIVNRNQYSAERFSEKTENIDGHLRMVAATTERFLETKDDEAGNKE